MNYEDFLKLPVLNGVTIIYKKSIEDYGVVPMETKDIDEIFLEITGYQL